MPEYGMNRSPEDRLAGHWVLAQIFNCETLGKLLRLSVPLLTPLQNGGN